MIITKDEPIKIDLNTHGGVRLQFSWGNIWNTLGNQWAITAKEATFSEKSEIKLFDSIPEAYIWAEENMHNVPVAKR